ncbi:MAG: polysaccharide biosynthesis C-terminal domain-containing protein [Kofleriaceae bacterium]|nr:polysaccharide biosynthesis C-terminal domain-containing protein [Myxococcales bacterium]MCB9562314.1 polysaccharide biosynthesis C-terminal domain-containing protein [Kofleriaceae bacterium]MCB9572077.1 polysaccharide biosynthesis C-terminal domain-containing protein [Kofleriaceae bacterium]
MSKSEGGGAGRGVLYIAFAKFYFMIAGAIIEFRLPAILARTVFGAYAVVSSVVSPINNVLVTGSIQAVSRFTAQRPETARMVQRAGLRMHLFVGLPVALLFIASAPLVAWLLHDTSKTGPLMLAGCIVGGYSFYAVFVGTANGRREFHKQAGLDVTFATLRVLGILGLAMAGLGLYGAVGGWVAAVGLILTISVVVVGLPGAEAREGEPMPVAPMIKFFAGVAIYLVLMNLIMFVDQLLLKRLTTEWYHQHGAQLQLDLDRLLPWARKVSGFHVDASQMADVQVAYYRAVQNLARLSYQAIIAATFVIFPLVSRSTFEDDQDTTRRYVHVTMRYSLIFATALAVVMAANPVPLLDIPYAIDYAKIGGPALIALALGNVAFSLFAICGTILNGAGHTRAAILTAAVTLVVAAAGNAIVIPRLDPGRDVLLGAAIVTGVAMVLGAAAAGYVVWRRLGAFLPILSIVRVIAAIAVAMGVGYVVPFRSPLMTLVEAALVGLTFLAVLVVTGELGKADLQSIIAVRKKRGTGGDA